MVMNNNDVKKSKKQIDIPVDAMMLFTEEVRERRRSRPEWLVNVMRKANGRDAKLILDKKDCLTETDEQNEQGHLLMPWNKIVDKDFLNNEELEIINKHHTGIYEKGLDVYFVNCSLNRSKVNLRRGDMQNSSNYVLVTGSSHVVDYNKIMKGHPMQLWSFRTRGGLYFAMTPLDLTPAPALVPVPDPCAASSSTSV